MRTNLLLVLGLLFALQADAQVRSQSNAASQRNQPASQVRAVQPERNAGARGGEGSRLRFQQPNLRVPGRAVSGSGSRGTGAGGQAGAAIRLNGTAGGGSFSSAGQQSLNTPVSSNPAGGVTTTSGAAAGRGALGGGGSVGVAGGGGTGISAPGGLHTDMMIQMQPGENLYIFPKTGTIAAQRLRAQREAAIRAARAAPAANGVRSVVEASNDAPVEDDSAEAPSSTEGETETLTTALVAPRAQGNDSGIEGEDQEEAEENGEENVGEAERSDVFPISIASGPLFDNDTLLEWQWQNALKGSPQSQYAIGLRYLTGTGLERDERRARDWFEKASAQGELRARARLRELKERREI